MTEMRTPSPDDAALEMTKLGGRTCMQLQSWLPEQSTRDRPVAIDGSALPSRVGATRPGSVRLLCVGARNWLVVSDTLSATAIAERFQSDLHRYAFALVDLTDGLTTVQIRGGTVREVLSKGCGLDLHPRHFPPGLCASTRLAHIAVLIECLEESRFELSVARSYFPYLQSWLRDAAR